MGWGPESRRGAINLTFDNLGEAAELEFGLWPANQPVGEHFTAKEVLPRILEELATVGLPATFFVEGWNGDVYADEIRAMRGQGHEVALHGWRHEVWSDQSADKRHEILTRGLNALSTPVTRPLGFRPPGGGTTRDTAAQLAGAGFSYISAAGEVPQKEGDLVSLPFQWPYVDALYFEPLMAPARENLFGTSEPRPIDEWQAALEALIEHALETGGYYSVIFHPYLLGLDPERFAPFCRFIRELSLSNQLWVAPCAEVARWMRRQPNTYLEHHN